MNGLLGLVLLAAAVGLVAIAVPRRGITRPVVRGSFMELLYPAFCLAVVVTGGATLVTGLFQ